MTHLVLKYLLSIYDKPGTILDVGDKGINKTNTA